MKENKGVTLLTLTITIIILLLLTGLALYNVVGEEGILKNVEEVKKQWIESSEKEKKDVNDALVQLEKISPISVSVSTILPEGWDTNKIKEVATVLNRKAPIPKGFEVSKIKGEDTITGGLVIYQTGDDNTETEGFWTETDEEGYLTCQTTYNQFVWIPVDDINQMVMCKSNTGASICNIEEINQTLQCTNPEHEENATKLCGRLYSTTSSSPDNVRYKTNMNFSNRTQTWSTTSFREPDIISYDTEETTEGLVEFEDQMKNDFLNMAKSIYKYGGFYISRYEVGENGESKKNIMLTEINEGGKTNWYRLYKATHIKLEGLQGHMIYGSQYDSIIKFLEEINEVQAGIKDRHLKYYAATGVNEKDKLNNIYNFEGNYREATAEATGNNTRLYRGGNVQMFKAGRVNSCSVRYSTIIPTNLQELNCTRVSFYL